MSEELKSFLHEKGIATSRSTPYNPRGNGQVERLNNTLWKAIMLSLKSKGLAVTQWELVLQDSLHSMRSLLCTETNATPHERMFQYTRRSTNSNSLPSWLLTPGPVYLKRHVRTSKYDPVVDEVELLEANTQYAHVRMADGRESTVSLRHLAPVGDERQTEASVPDSCEPLTPPSNNQIQSTSESDATGSDQIPETVYPPASPTLSEQTTNTTKTPFVRTSPYNLRIFCV